MPFVHLPETTIYFEQTGTGRDLLIISGTGSDLRLPRLPSPLIDETFKVLRYDHRGLGQSSADDNPISMANFADDAAGLLSELDIAEIDVIGISFGGMVAQHLAIRHPKLIRKLVLACTSPGGETYSSADLLQLMDLPLEERQKAWLEMYDTRYQSGSTGKQFVYLLEKLITRNPSMFPNEASKGLMRQISARSSHDLSGDLRKISHRCLVVGGRYDGIAPPENLHYLSNNLQNCELRFFEGGHSFLWEDESAWKSISAFLAKDDGTL